MILELEEATFSNLDGVIDSRDVISRIQEIKEYLELLGEEEKETPVEEKTDPSYTNNELLNAREEARKELEILKKLEAECEGYSDWEYGETLIRDTYFEDYARELAEDCGSISGDEKWPLNCIDWEEASRELQYDYTQVSFDGVDYWIRSC